MQKILDQLPYSKPFLFVDEILEADENSITGTFLFTADLDFYSGHFHGDPVTPGVILTECMAQIGLVSLGIYLLNKESINENRAKIALSSTHIDFLKPVFPGEKVWVRSEKQYFRFNKLKCRVEMYNANDEIVARGNIAGMIIKESHQK